MGIIDAALDLKGVYRRGWIEKAGISEPESVADHSYATGVIAMVLADADGLDAGRAIRMALLHDIAEAITGDITPGSMTREEKARLEHQAMETLLGGLSGKVRERCREAWQEDLEQSTPEAVLVHDADRLEMALQARRYAGDMQDGVLEEFLASSRRGITGSRAAGILREIS